MTFYPVDSVHIVHPPVNFKKILHIDYSDLLFSLPLLRLLTYGSSGKTSLFGSTPS